MERKDSIVLTTAVCLLALSAWLQVFLDPGGDKDWLLLAAKMWLEGKKLYTGIVEVNPPLILWLYAIPASLAEFSGFMDYQVLAITGLCICFAAIALCLRLIGFHPMFAHDKRARVQCGFLLAGLFVFVIPQSSFFDREHILWVMTFPYVLRFAPTLAQRELPWKLRLAVGAMAAVGFCIKPHALILFAMVQMFAVARERSFAFFRAPENLIVVFFALAYLLCVRFFTPEYIRAILPMALETYTSFSRSGSSLLCLPPVLICAGLTFADFRLRFSTPYRRDIFYYIGIALAFLAYAFVSNGWDYTYLPLQCTILALSGLAFCEYRWLERDAESRCLPSRQFTFGMRGCLISLATQIGYMGFITVMSIGVLAIQYNCSQHPECMLKNSFVRYVHDHSVSSFGAIAEEFPPWTALARTSDARWETRFNHLWMLPQLLKESEQPVMRHRWVFDYVARALVEDLNVRRPEIVFVDTGRQFSIYPNYKDLIAFFSADPAFASAWSRYRYSGSINQCDMTSSSLINEGCQSDIYSRIP